MNAWLERQAFVLVTSTPQLDELKRVVTYEHLRPRMVPHVVVDLLENIDVGAEVLDALPPVDLSPDPDDNAILATAIAGRADLIVSGDKRHLLTLRQVEGIRIISAREALIAIGIEPPT